MEVKVGGVTLIHSLWEKSKISKFEVSLVCIMYFT